MVYKFDKLEDFLTEIKKRDGLVIRESDEMFVNWNLNKAVLLHVKYTSDSNLMPYVIWANDEYVVYSFKEEE